MATNQTQPQPKAVVLTDKDRFFLDAKFKSHSDLYAFFSIRK